MTLDGIEAFVRVVQAGSFSAAAKLMGMPLTTVSGQVAALEKRLGVTLLQRTTRKLHITQAGETFFRRCLKVVEEMEAGERELATTKEEPEGVLRLTAPGDAGHTLLPPIVSEYLRRHPRVQVELILTNRVVDLVGEGVDLALRASVLPNSTLIARKFIESDAALWATPEYLERGRAPKHPRDLEKHQGVLFTPLAHAKLTRGEETCELNWDGRVRADNFDAVKAFVLAGEGIGLIPEFFVVPELARGALVRVLPAWKLRGGKLMFVYPAQRFVAPRVTAFIECALQTFRSGPAAVILRQ